MFFFGYFTKIKITFNFKTASFFRDWLHWKCVDTYFELFSFYWNERNLLSQHRFQDMIAVKLIRVWTTFYSSWCRLDHQVRCCCRASSHVTGLQVRTKSLSSDLLWKSWAGCWSPTVQRWLFLWDLDFLDFLDFQEPLTWFMFCLQPSVGRKCIHPEVFLFRGELRQVQSVHLALTESEHQAAGYCQSARDCWLV